jgi:hypothetical protein
MKVGLRPKVKGEKYQPLMFIQINKTYTSGCTVRKIQSMYCKNYSMNHDSRLNNNPFGENTQ